MFTYFTIRHVLDLSFMYNRFLYFASLSGSSFLLTSIDEICFYKVESITVPGLLYTRLGLLFLKDSTGVVELDLDF